jgi:hypothetical protein
MDLTETKLGIAELRGDLAELTSLGETFGHTMSSAFVSAAVDGRKLSDVLRSLMLSMSRQALTSALKPLTGILGGPRGRHRRLSGCGLELLHAADRLAPVACR